MTRYKYLVGIDEVGRGPLAGPVTIGAVLVENTKLLRGIKDSKKLTKNKRELWFEKVKRLKEVGKLKYSASFVGPEIIDRDGIAKCLNLAIHRSLKKLNIQIEDTLIILDGGLKAHKKYINQRTIIKGDEKRKVIACASVVAKVLRDRRMENYSKIFPEYMFGSHKGYGTKNHFKMIKKYGICPIHRRSFLSGV